MVASAESSPEQVGARIRAIRAQFGVSQAKLAEIVGVTPAAVGNWEQGRSRPTIEQAQAIIDRYDLTLDYIFLGREHTLKHAVAQDLAASLSATRSSKDAPLS